MKKILLLLITFIFITGCSMDTNSPTKEVENFFSKYQNIDNSVLEELDNTIKKDKVMDDKLKDSYKELMIIQYKNLSYKIKNEIITKDSAIVDTTIEVLDYSSSIRESRLYFNNHLDEFKIDIPTNDINDSKEFVKYKLDNLYTVTNTIKYDITFNLSKIDNKWVIDDLTDSDILKIHGIYE